MSNGSVKRVADVPMGSAKRRAPIDTITAKLAFFHGIFLETFDALATSDGATVTMSLEQSGGGDLTMVFSDGHSIFDTTPAATIALTAGADASPTENFIYILQSTKVLTKSTSAWPTAEHIKVGYFLVPSAGFVQANGCYVNQNWNDHVQDAGSLGHLNHIVEAIRARSAIYKSGVVLTVTVGGGATVDVAVTAGVVYQMHRHSTSATDTATGDKILVVNQNGAAYDDVTDLETLTNDSTGAAVGKYFNWVIWGVVNKTGEFQPLMLNLPTGSYNQQSAAEGDVSGYDVLTLPAAFSTDSTTGFLIARVTMSKIGGTWAHVSTVDLRGATPQSAVGGVGGVTTEFADNAFKLFDEGDNTKELDFQVSGVSASTTRTITMPDQNIDLTPDTGSFIKNLSADATPQLGGDLDVNTHGLVSTSNGDIPITPDGTGRVKLNKVTDIIGPATGGRTDYDLNVGDTATPDYGIVRIGNMVIGRTSFKAGAIDLDGAILIQNKGGPVTGEIEFCFAESTGDDTRLAIPKSGVGNATYHPRSMLLIGPAPADTDYVKVAYWQALGWFHNLLCDTGAHGADLGVENDLEVEGRIWAKEIYESTPGGGVTLGPAGDTSIGDGTLRTVYPQTDAKIDLGETTTPRRFNKVIAKDCLQCLAGTGTDYFCAGGVIDVNVTDVGNVDDGLDPLIVYAMPANTLAVDGDSLEVVCAGEFANNANDKTIIFAFGGTNVVLATGGSTTATDWRIQATIVRTGANTQRAIASFVTGDAVVTTTAGYATPGEDTTGAISLGCTCIGIATDDIVQHFMKTIFHPAPPT